ncbi:macrosialin [Conger conger]|uniref:macrosialin n=1 Tax=Conger conger TaxID=82655 RepID=UPI002A5A2106|nr:macrosialin [Conger conger]
MKNGFMLFMACAITIAVAVSKDNEKESDPSASLSPAQQFGATTAHPNVTTAHPNVTTAHPNVTTAHPNVTTAHPNVTTAHPNVTTAHPNVTTAHPNVTTAHPNVTTAHPNVTTAHPNVTTAHPNVTTTHPNVTTTHPSTTTTHPNTTTPETPTPPTPTSKANLTGGEYTLKCALLSMELQIKVEYDSNSKSEGIYIVQPRTTTVQGNCGNSSVNFNLTFKEGFIDFRFEKNDTEKLVYVSSVAVELTYPFDRADPKTRYAASNSSVKLFSAAIGQSYSCRNQSLYLGKGIHLEMTKGRMEAFNTTKDFGPPNPCPADKQDYRVAIAVGIVLLILIVIVVVAYIIGRRKRNDGYQAL